MDGWMKKWEDEQIDRWVNEILDLDREGNISRYINIHIHGGLV